MVRPASPVNACSTKPHWRAPIDQVQTRVAGLRPLSSGALRLRDVDPRGEVPPPPSPFPGAGSPLPRLPLQLARSRAAAGYVSVSSLHPAPTPFAAAEPPSLTSLLHSASRLPVGSIRGLTAASLPTGFEIDYGNLPVPTMGIRPQLVDKTAKSSFYRQTLLFRPAGLS